ncbi:hypothetical protein Tco_0198801 [Tanacetum coccineum]
MPAPVVLLARYYIMALGQGSIPREKTMLAMKIIDRISLQLLSGDRKNSDDCLNLPYQICQISDSYPRMVEAAWEAFDKFRYKELGS